MMAPEAFVEVLVDGVYNDPEHRAQRAAAGSYITVAGGWYVESLVASGFVVEVGEREYRDHGREWHEGDNMEGIGPHVEAALTQNDAPVDTTPPIVIDPVIIQLADELNDLDAAFGMVNQAPVVDAPVAPPAPANPPDRIPESKVVSAAPKRDLQPESRGGRKRG